LATAEPTVFPVLTGQSPDIKASKPTVLSLKGLAPANQQVARIGSKTGSPVS